MLKGANDPNKDQHRAKEYNKAPPPRVLRLTLVDCLDGIDLSRAVRTHRCVYMNRIPAELTVFAARHGFRAL